MYACAMKSIPMPPYSWGRWGAQRPSALTFLRTSSRNARASARSTSLAWSRRPAHITFSLGRIFSLTMRAVRILMSLISSLSPAMGVTLMGMVLPLGFVVVRRRASLRGTPRGVFVHHPASGQGPLVATSPDEADRPTGQRRKPVLEAGEEGHVDDEP